MRAMAKNTAQKLWKAVPQQLGWKRGEMQGKAKLQSCNQKALNSTKAPKALRPPAVGMAWRNCTLDPNCNVAMCVWHFCL